jgi:hypothetical protein
MLSRTLNNGLLANVDPETGISYGVISLNSIDSYTLEDIYQNGEDLSYKAAREEAEKEFSMLKYNPDGTPLDDDYLESAMQEWDEAYQNDNDAYLYTSEGITVQTSGDGSTLWVFKSPYTRLVSQCSPCVPNAGDLNTETAKWNSQGAPVNAYDLPQTWLRNDSEDGPW